MGGESQVLVEVWRAVQYFFNAPWAQIQPYIDRILHVTIVYFVLRWWYRKFIK
jgi:hypothetical protein